MTSTSALPTLVHLLQRGDGWHGPCLCTFHANPMGHPLNFYADGSASGQLKADTNDDLGGIHSYPSPTNTVYLP